MKCEGWSFKHAAMRKRAGEYSADKQQWKKNLIQSRTLMEMLQNSIKGNFAYPAKKVYSRVMQKYPLTDIPGCFSSLYSWFGFDKAFDRNSYRNHTCFVLERERVGESFPNAEPPAKQRQVKRQNRSPWHVRGS